MTTEALARLVDEAPRGRQRRHLLECPACQAELAALHAQTEALGALPDLRPAVGDWEELEARLMSEGLIHEGGGFRRRIAPAAAPWMQVAAGLALLLGGTALGAGLARPGGEDAPVPRAVGQTALPVASAGTLDEAAEAVRVAEENYVQALVRYRELVQGESEVVPQDPAGRYAALDYLVAATQAAASQAPADPFLNGFLASAVAERQAAYRNIPTPETGNWY